MCMWVTYTKNSSKHTLSPTSECHIPRNRTTQTIAMVWNCHRNKVAKDHRIENNSSKNKHRARCWTHSSRWVARRMGHFRSERWTIDETCSKVLWFDYVMCTELYDHTGDNNGTIKQNTELNHTPTQSVPTQPIYVHSTHHNLFLLYPPKYAAFQNLEPWFPVGNCIFQTQHCWSLLLFLTAVQGERSPLAVRHLCISNDNSQYQKINFHHCRHTSASIHWYQESQCSPPQPQFFKLATHQSQHSIYI